MIDDVLDDLKSSFNSSLKSLRSTLSKVRTGRANPALLDGVKVDYYGTPTPLIQVGAVKVADARLITVQPWEHSMIQAIEKAIVTADLGLNPTNDGTVIRIPIPPLTGERRKQLSKVARGYGEDSKVALRNQRRDGNDMLKDAEKESEISEDDLHRGLAKIQDMTNDYVKKIDSIITDKEAEIMEI